MNQRIKELIKQATKTEYGVDNGFDRVTLDEDKFARLIAKDCADHIMNTSDRYRKEYFAGLILTRYNINDKHDWIIKKVPNTKDQYYVESGTPPKYVLAVYGITQ